MELKETKNKSLNRVLDYLKERSKEDDLLSKSIEEITKTPNDLWNYITSEARKQSSKGCACITDEEVYEWAVHWCLEKGNIEVKGTKASATKEDNEDVEETEDEDFIEEKQPVKKQEKVTPKFTNTKPKKNDLFGGESLFDL